MSNVIVGSRAPEFTLVDMEMNERNLKEFLGKKVILAFYPGAFTSVCKREMCTFRDALSRLESLDAQVVGISVNDPFSNKAFHEMNMLNFPVLCDYEREVVKAYGVFHEDFAGLKGYTAAKRAVFILDREGVIRYKWVSDNPGVEPNYTEIEEKLAKID
jgi:peroxiredoxin